MSAALFVMFKFLDRKLFTGETIMFIMFRRGTLPIERQDIEAVFGNRDGTGGAWFFVKEFEGGCKFYYGVYQHAISREIIYAASSVSSDDDAAFLGWLGNNLGLNGLSAK